MPVFFGTRIDDILDIEVMIIAVRDDHILVSEGMPNADWKALLELYHKHADLDRSLLPRRDLATKCFIIEHNYSSLDCLARVMTCRCKVVKARHPTLLQPMLRLRLYQKPFVLPK